MECVQALVSRGMARTLGVSGRENEAALLARLAGGAAGLAALGAALSLRPAAALPALAHVCAAVAAPVRLALAVERCLESFATWAPAWSPALAAFSFPQLDPEEFLEAAVRDQCVLTLVVCCMKNRETTRLVPGWISQIRVTPTVCWKMPLLWAIALASGAAGIQEQLVKVWTELGRDTSSNAVVSLLGFGEKSPFPVEFRVFCRLFRNFVAPDSKDLRLVSQQIKSPKLDEAIAWIERHQPLIKALELVQLVGPLLFSNIKAWNLA